MMRRAGTLALVLASAPMLSGCIAAALAIPLAAGGALGAKQMSGSDERAAERQVPAPSPSPSGTPTPTPGVAPFRIVGVVSGGLPTPGGPPPTVEGQTSDAPRTPPAGMQYLYGSGEAAALSLQAYQQLWTFLQARAQDRAASLEIRTAVLAPDGTLEAPRFMTCGRKPLAVVFDIDETVMLNLGFEADDAQRSGGYDDRRWKRWEATGAQAVAPVPGAVETIDGARRLGITVVFNSNRSEANAAATVAALETAGLGHAELGKTLWLRGDGPNSSGKDARRWAISAKYCVVALVGDQLGDFTDLFNPGGVPVPIRRNMASQTLSSAMWGAGWFMLPNPVYGTGLHGSLDDIFPRDKRWVDPGEAPPAPAPEPAPAATAAPQ